MYVFWIYSTSPTKIRFEVYALKYSPKVHFLSAESEI